MPADHAALLRSFIDDLVSVESLLSDLERRAADLRLSVGDQTDLKIARRHVASVRSWRQRMEGDRG